MPTGIFTGSRNGMTEHWRRESWSTAARSVSERTPRFSRLVEAESVLFVRSMIPTPATAPSEAETAVKYDEYRSPESPGTRSPSRCDPEANEPRPVKGAACPTDMIRPEEVRENSFFFAGSAISVEGSAKNTHVRALKKHPKPLPLKDFRSHHWSPLEYPVELHGEPVGITHRPIDFENVAIERFSRGERRRKGIGGEDVLDRAYGLDDGPDRVGLGWRYGGWDLLDSSGHLAPGWNIHDREESGDDPGE